jgi:serine/threonine protein kinase
MQDIESTFQVGHSLRGQYTVIDVLGQGAFGAVYLVKDEQDSHKRFVLKEVINAHRKERNVFSFYAAALKRLHHPAVGYKLRMDGNRVVRAAIMVIMSGLVFPRSLMVKRALSLCFGAKLA